MNACEKGDVEIVSKLISHEADINAKNMVRRDYSLPFDSANIVWSDSSY